MNAWINKQIDVILDKNILNCKIIGLATFVYIILVRKKYSVSLHSFYESPPPKLVLQMLFFSPFYQWWNQNFGRFISVCSVKGSGNGTAWINPRANWPQKLCSSLLPEGWKECLSCVLSSFEVVETVESRYWGYFYTLMRYHPIA